MSYPTEPVLRTINNKPHYCLETEFNVVPHKIYNNLQILANLGALERIVGLLRELASSLQIPALCHQHATHGAFVSTECSANFGKIHLSMDPIHFDPVARNIEPYNNIDILLMPFLAEENCIIYDETGDEESSLWREGYVLLSPRVVANAYRLSGTDLYLSIPQHLSNQFQQAFRYWLSPILGDNQGTQLTYDNCLNICFMVKNSGPKFEQVLEQNKPYMDSWTVLDTGSTDDTIETANRTLRDKHGTLYQEPFINFPDSRNRCLELAGTHCKYTLMLDDSYIIKGGLREFLNLIRGDQFADSYNLYVLSGDVQYTSNRLLKTDRHLKYTGMLHEIISPVNNINVTIPINEAQIYDEQSDYMSDRTTERKSYDLARLEDMLKQDPNDSRALYYLAQAHNLLGHYEQAYDLFIQRAKMTDIGFSQEVADSWLEAGRCSQFHLKMPPEVFLNHYEQSFLAEPARPESQYYIGLYYKSIGDLSKALFYLTRAYYIGYPINKEFSLKPTLSFYFLPTFLSEVCYTASEGGRPTYQLGLDACNLFFAYMSNSMMIKQPSMQYDVYRMQQWQRIFSLLLQVKPIEPARRPLCCFVADGGWEPWTGKDILRKGMGGSETYIIEMSKWIQRFGNYDTIVFCNCNEADIYENVTYIPLSKYPEFIATNHVDTVIISRYTEYIPCTIAGHVDKIHLVLHDVLQEGQIIATHPKLKRIYCLSEWHVSQLLSLFPQVTDKAVPLYYGLDWQAAGAPEKRPYSFIYSSFANRGLLPLLQMWPLIYEREPRATLHLFCDVDHWWVNQVAPEMAQQIRELLLKFGETNGIYYHGWVNKAALMAGWETADVWFYPTTFNETFCLTALECARSKTLAITMDLGSLSNVVGDRGVLLKGDPMNPDWQREAVNLVFDYLGDTERKQRLVEENYKWSLEYTWEGQAKRLNQSFLNAL
jgi:tetratricopeptide (TPR) repeat protein